MLIKGLRTTSYELEYFRSGSQDLLQYLPSVRSAHDWAAIGHLLSCIQTENHAARSAHRPGHLWKHSTSWSMMDIELQSKTCAYLIHTMVSLRLFEVIASSRSRSSSSQLGGRSRSSSSGASSSSSIGGCSSSGTGGSSTHAICTSGCAPVHSTHTLCVVEEMRLVVCSARHHYQLLELRPRSHFHAQIHRVLQKNIFKICDITTSEQQGNKQDKH